MKGLRADVLVANSGMMGLLRGLGLQNVPLPEAGVYSVELGAISRNSQPAGSAV
jgi:hypothetical protein